MSEERIAGIIAAAVSIVIVVVAFTALVNPRWV